MKCIPPIASVNSGLLQAPHAALASAADTGHQHWKCSEFFSSLCDLHGLQKDRFEDKEEQQKAT